MVIKQIISTPETGMNVLNLFSRLIPAFGVFFVGLFSKLFMKIIIQNKQIKWLESESLTNK